MLINMAGRIVGGLGGWLVSLAPLVVVNILAFTTAIDPGIIPIAGGVALVLGIALGGLLAGVLGGRRGGGGWGGTVAGAIAALLFAATLITLMYLLRAQHQLPYLLALHPVRAMGAIGFIASLVMLVAAAVGALSGRRGTQSAKEGSAQAARAPMRERAPGASSQPYRRPGEDDWPPRDMRRPSRPSHPSQPASPSPSATRRIAESHTQERPPRW
jgi:hypothetical protein